jgi:hypothetical protein
VNIKIDLKEIGLEGVDWIYLAEDMVLWRPLANTVGLLDSIKAITARRPAILTESFHVLPQSLHANAGIVP